MKRTAFHRYWIPSPTGKRKLSSWRMTAEDAAAYPGAEPDLQSVEWRDLPETPEEHAQAMRMHGAGTIMNRS